MRLRGTGNRRGALRMLRLRCVTIEMQGEKEDSLAVNRWTLPRRRPRRFRARNSRAALIIIGLFAFVCCGAGAPVVRADEAANAAARELARKLAAQLEPKQMLHLEFADLDRSLPKADIAEAERQFEEEIQSQGFRLSTDPPGDVSVRISFSEDNANQLWVASFLKEGKPVVTIVSFAKSQEIRPDFSSAKLVRLQAQLVFEQSDPILDFVVLNKRFEPITQILVLGTDSLSLYEMSDGRWQVRNSQKIPHKSRLPRDPRGMLWISDGAFWAGTPGTSCDGTIRDHRISMKCDSSAKKWSYGLGDVIFVDAELAVGRNYFVKRDQKDAVVETYYSSDSVVIPVSCAATQVILATGDGDFTMQDSLGAFVYEEGRRVQAGPRIELDGPVTEIWENEPGGMGKPRVIVKNLRSGHYEAYQITLACDR